MVFADYDIPFGQLLVAAPAEGVRLLDVCRALAGPPLCLPGKGQASQNARMAFCSAFALEYPRAAAAALMP
jgi:hypothetical protein